MITIMHRRYLPPALQITNEMHVALARELLMVIPLPLHFLRNLLLSIIVPSQLGVHLRQRRVLDKILELEEGVRIGF